MMTLFQLEAEPPTVLTQTTWYLANLVEARGKQKLFARQSPHKKPRPFTGLFHPLLHQHMTAQVCVHDLDLSFLRQDARAS